MSNKQQLQINNANLDSLITRVNAAKDTAASLPEAGSGGVDTCTVTIASLSTSMIGFTDGDMNYQSFQFDNTPRECIIAKNTLLWILCNPNNMLDTDLDYQSISIEPATNEKIIIIQVNKDGYVGITSSTDPT